MPIKTAHSNHRLGLFVLLALLGHLLLGLIANETIAHFPKTAQPATRVVTLLIRPTAKEHSKPKAKPEEPEGQLVDIAPPIIEEKPPEADFLAEHNARVEKETRAKETRVNPEVLSHIFSNEDKMEKADLVDLQIEKPSTGARVGTERFDPAKDGKLASLPSPWRLSNKDGLEAPVPSSHASANMTGAPNNDLIKRPRADSLNLNTKEFLYASYLNRIRRLVNFYWDQNLDNLPSSTRLLRPQYITTVRATLTGTGGLEHIEIIKKSNVAALDNCVTRAFAVAGPFAHPPDGLIDADGFVRLPVMSFTVVLGKAQNHYQGVDPRAGVQFPGLLKSPR